MKSSSPLSVQRALVTLGRNVRRGRRARRMSMADFAARLQVGTQTVQRLERGDGGVSARTLAMAFLALGELRQFEALMDPASDDAGLLLAEDHLPQRVRRARVAVSPRTGAEPIDPEGAVF